MLCDSKDFLAVSDKKRGRGPQVAFCNHNYNSNCDESWLNSDTCRLHPYNCQPVKGPTRPGFAVEVTTQRARRNSHLLCPSIIPDRSDVAIYDRNNFEILIKKDNFHWAPRFCMLHFEFVSLFLNLRSLGLKLGWD
jgi:hypothetical protein